MSNGNYNNPEHKDQLFPKGWLGELGTEPSLYDLPRQLAQDAQDVLEQRKLPVIVIDHSEYEALTEILKVCSMITSDIITPAKKLSLKLQGELNT